MSERDADGNLISNAVGRKLNDNQRYRSRYRRDANDQFLYNKDENREFTPEAKQYLEKRSKRNADYKVLFALALKQRNLDLYLKKHNRGPDPTCRTTYVAAELAVLRDRFKVPFITSDEVIFTTYKSVIAFYSNHNYRKYEEEIKEEHVNLIMSELEVDPPL